MVLYGISGSLISSAQSAFMTVLLPDDLHLADSTSLALVRLLVYRLAGELASTPPSPGAAER